MARGSLKSDLNWAGKPRGDDYDDEFRDGVRYVSVDGDRDKGMIEAVRKYLKVIPIPNMIPVNIEFPGEEFLNKVNSYNGSVPQNRTPEGQKKIKQDIADLLKTLPKELQELILVPKSSMKKLYRGATHKSNPGPDGTINASFTSFKEHADFFITASKSMMRYARQSYPEDQHRVYDAKDVKSFDKIISIGAAAKMLAIIDYLSFEKINITNKVPWSKIRYNDEGEYLVTNIKWKG